MIKFIGTDKNNELISMTYVIVFFSTLLFVLLFAAITVFCFGLKKMYTAKSQASEASRSASAHRESMRSSIRPVIEEGNIE